ncbi:hypothetical protein Bhyg_16889 [Pseudolycoriella hygida]|uniref:Uncharacterized protein n=1 Tax=Pseudolycoriella hygida TaxID=35572 RepID=A0A9Q0ML59_9DIPT|nr:hypothetical protein Bhyg_16889 [Pseudolycoriella hygida]
MKPLSNFFKPTQTEQSSISNESGIVSNNYLKLEPQIDVENDPIDLRDQTCTDQSRVNLNGNTIEIIQEVQSARQYDNDQPCSSNSNEHLDRNEGT